MTLAIFVRDDEGGTMQTERSINIDWDIGALDSCNHFVKYVAAWMSK